MSTWFRRHYGTVVLVILAAVLGVLLWRDQGAVTTDEADKRKADLFDVWRRDDVTRLAITARGKTAIVTRTQASDAGARGWSVEIAGATYDADAQSVDDVLGKLEFAAWERKTPSVDRAAAKLDSPPTAIDVAMGEQSMRLVVGGEAPTPPGARYAEVPGRGIFVITRELAAALDVDVDGLRTRTFVPYFAADLDALELGNGASAIRLEHAPWGGGRGAGYRFDAANSDGPVRADAAAVDRILLALGRMQAERYLDDTDAERALQKRVTIRLVPKDKAMKPGVIDLGGPCPVIGDGGEAHGVVAIRRGPTRAAACVAEDVMDALATPKEDLLDRHPIGAAIDEVSEVRVDDGGKILDLARTGSAFHLRAPSDRAVDADVGRAVLEAMLKVSGTLSVRDSTWLTRRGSIRVISPDLTQTTGRDGGSAERVESIDLLADKDGSLYARRSEDGVLLALTPEGARDLVPSDLALRAHRIYDEPNKRFRSLRIERGTDVQTLTRIANGGWTLATPKGVGLVVDSGLANEVADAVGRLAAERWVTDKNDPSFGLDYPHMVVEAVVGDEGAAASKTLRISIGAPTTNGSFARVDGDPAIFVAPKGFEMTAGRWLLDRTVFMVEPSTLTRVVLKKGGKRLTFEQAGGVFKSTSSQSPEASPRAAEVRDALSDLLAEGAVSIGPAAKGQGFDKPILDVTIERSGAGLLHFALGDGDSFRGIDVFYARRDGVDATYAIARSKILPLIDAL